MRSISAAELKVLLAQGNCPKLIDVRRQEEHEAFNIGGQLIPFEEIADHISDFEGPNDIILYCEKGIRSVIAIQKLQCRINTEHLINLNGGVSAFRK